MGYEPDAIELSKKIIDTINKEFNIIFRKTWVKLQIPNGICCIPCPTSFIEVKTDMAIHGNEGLRVKVLIKLDSDIIRTTTMTIDEPFFKFSSSSQDKEYKPIIEKALYDWRNDITDTFLEYIESQAQSKVI